MADSHSTHIAPVNEPAPDGWATEHIALSQTCPLCLGAVVGYNTRKNGRVMLAKYGCALGHRWNLTWVLEQAPE